LEERRELRFISPEPKLALLMREWKPLVIPQALYDWAVGWVEDVGRTMRSREYMVGAVASTAYTGLIVGVFRLAPALREFKFLAEILGVG